LFHAAYAAALRENLPEKADDILIDEASADFDCGMTAAARAVLQRVSPQHADNPEAAFLHAALGDAASAERALAARGGADSSDTLMTYVHGPRIRAEIALNAGKPLQAIEELQPALDYDFAEGFGIMAERGEAYMKAKQPEKAMIEYQKILDHPGVDPVSPLFPLALLGKARAESQAGRVAESRADYEKLFAQWRDADADLPVLQDARREYGLLGAARGPQATTRAKQ
jgi:tetratricopeptide (TPR) repeat protein